MEYYRSYMIIPLHTIKLEAIVFEKTIKRTIKKLKNN